MANKPGEANFFPDVPEFPSMGVFQPIYGKFDLTTYIQGASDYEIMAFLVGKYNACLEAYGNITKLSTDTITACKQLQDWINSWFTNLDVQEEINKKLDKMVADGSFGTLLHQTFDAQINQQTTSAVTKWLVANVTPTGSAVVVDKSLSIEGAAADAKQVGLNRATLTINESKQLNIIITHENNLFSFDTDWKGIIDIANAIGVSRIINKPAPLTTALEPGNYAIYLYYTKDEDYFQWHIGVSKTTECYGNGNPATYTVATIIVTSDNFEVFWKYEKPIINSYGSLVTWENNYLDVLITSKNNTYTFDTDWKGIIDIANAIGVSRIINKPAPLTTALEPGNYAIYLYYTKDEDYFQWHIGVSKTTECYGNGNPATYTVATIIVTSDNFEVFWKYEKPIINSYGSLVTWENNYLDVLITSKNNTYTFDTDWNDVVDIANANGVSRISSKPVPFTATLEPGNYAIYLYYTSDDTGFTWHIGVGKTSVLPTIFTNIYTVMTIIVNATSYNVWWKFNQNRAYNKGNAVCFGDSTSYGVIGGQNGQSPFNYPSAIAAALNMTVSNKAVGGQGLLKDWQTIVDTINNTNFSNIKLCTVAWAYNDYALYPSYNLGTIDDTTNNTVLGAYRTILDIVQTKNINTRVILITGYGYPNITAGEKMMEHPIHFKDVTITAREYYNKLEEMCTKHGYTCINQASAPWLNLNNISLIGDNIHPTNNGYKVYSDYIVGRISAVFNPIN